MNKFNTRSRYCKLLLVIPEWFPHYTYREIYQLSNGCLYWYNLERYKRNLFGKAKDIFQFQIL